MYKIINNLKNINYAQLLFYFFKQIFNKDYNITFENY